MADHHSTTLYLPDPSSTQKRKFPLGLLAQKNQPGQTEVDTTKIPFTTSIITNPIINLPAVIHDPARHTYEPLRIGDLREYAEKDLKVTRLQDVRQYLWLCGARGKYRPLHRQKGFYSRTIVIIEQGDLHLTWDAEALRLFLKPLPAYLLNRQFWEDHICKDSDPEKTTFRNALGFLRSYVHLIPTETDFDHAIEERLLPRIHTLPRKGPENDQGGTGSVRSYRSNSEKSERGARDEDITWPQWRAFVEEFLTIYPDSIPGELRKTRWEYSELRLGRLNMVYRICRGFVFRGYAFGYASYGSFLSRNSSWLIAAFAYVAIVHGAMQVGLGTPQLEGNEAFARACFGFAVFSIIAPAGVLTLLLVCMGGMFISNFVWTRKEKKKFRVARVPEDLESPPSSVAKPPTSPSTS